MKRIEKIVAVLMCLCVLNVTVYADDTADTYDLWVGNVKVTAANASDVLGDGTVSYDADENTLTLNGVNITDRYYKDTSGMVQSIYANQDLDIILIGDENKIETPDAVGSSLGIYVKGNLNISGSGKLYVQAGDVNGDEDCYSMGICVEGQLSINEAVVTANGGDVVSNTAAASTCGAYSEGGMVIESDGELNAAGGKAIGVIAFSEGIECYGEENQYENIALYDGILEANGGEASGMSYSVSAGVYGEYMSFYTYDMSSQAILSSSKSEVTSASEQDESYASSNGIYIYGGDVCISAGTVTVNAGEYSGIAGDGYGIYVENAVEYDNNEIVRYIGGNITIECDEVVANPNRPGVVGTKVSIETANEYAMIATMGIDIDDSLTIDGCEEYTVKHKVESDGRTAYMLVDKQGEYVKELTVAPLTYRVKINGLSYGMAVDVPVNKSINDVYCEKFQVSDFSEVLNTEKDGYEFVGWYTDEALTEGNEFEFDAPISENISIYPKWVMKASADLNNKDKDKLVENPQTGDETNVILYISILIVCFAIVLRGKRFVKE